MKDKNILINFYYHANELNIEDGKFIINNMSVIISSGGDWSMI